MLSCKARHSSTLAWKIPWMKEPDGASMGSLRVRHHWAASLSFFTVMHWRRKWQPTPVFLPGESQGQGSLVGCCLWVTQSRTRLKQLSSKSSSILMASLYFTYSDVPSLPHNKRKKRKQFGIGRGWCEIKEDFFQSCKHPPEEAGDF